MKHLRTSLALLLAVLLLCSVMPLSGLVSAANANLIVNGDFEAGMSNWNKLVDTIEVVDDPTNSGHGKVMKTNETGSEKHMFDQTLSNLDANGDSILTFKVYCYSTVAQPAFYATIGYNCKVSYELANVTGLPAKTVNSNSSTRVRLDL